MEDVMNDTPARVNLQRDMARQRPRALGWVFASTKSHRRAAVRAKRGSADPWTERHAEGAGHSRPRATRGEQAPPFGRLCRLDQMRSEARFIAIDGKVRTDAAYQLYVDAMGTPQFYF